MRDHVINSYETVKTNNYILLLKFSIITRPDSWPLMTVFRFSNFKEFVIISVVHFIICYQFIYLRVYIELAVVGI